MDIVKKKVVCYYSNIRYRCILVGGKMNMEDEIKLVRKHSNTIDNKKQEDRKKKNGLFFILMHRGNRGRMLLLLVALFVTGVLLSGSTYAWFTANYTVSVSSINVNVASGSGIQISANAVDWKAIVNTTELTTGYTGHLNQMPTGQLNPVSTVKKLNVNNRLDMYKGIVETNDGGDYILTSALIDDSVANTVSDFIAFDVFVKLDYAQTTPIYLTAGTGVIANTGAAGATDTGIQYASRMAFIIQGNTSAGSDVETIQGISNGTHPVYFYEPNYDVHNATGVNNAANVYGITTYLNTDAYKIANPDGEDINPILTYSGVKAVISKGDNIKLGDAKQSTDATKFEDITIDYKTVAGNDTVTPIFSLEPGVTKIRVYMWVEGQDVDCENGASGGSITYNLGFTTQDGAGA